MSVNRHVSALLTTMLRSWDELSFSDLLEGSEIFVEGDIVTFKLGASDHQLLLYRHSKHLFSILDDIVDSLRHVGAEPVKIRELRFSNSEDQRLSQSISRDRCEKMKARNINFWERKVAEKLSLDRDIASYLRALSPDNLVRWIEAPERSEPIVMTCNTGAQHRVAISPGYASFIDTDWAKFKMDFQNKARFPSGGAEALSKLVMTSGGGIIQTHSWVADRHDKPDQDWRWYGSIIEVNLYGNSCRLTFLEGQESGNLRMI